MSCDPVGCVALCFTSSREFRGAWSCMAERNFGQTSVSLRLNRTSATCACRGVVRWRCPCGDINGAGLCVSHWPSYDSCPLLLSQFSRFWITSRFFTPIICVVHFQTIGMSLSLQFTNASVKIINFTFLLQDFRICFCE